MEFKDVLLTRRSIRGFDGKDVPVEILTQIIDDARFTPNGGNCQPWHFYIVKNKDVIKEIADKVYVHEWFKSVGAAIIVTLEAERTSSKYGERGRDLYCIQDSGAVVQSILLGAKDNGIDSCWLGAFDEAACSEVLALGKNIRPVAILALGYQSGKTKQGNRRPIEEVLTII